MAETAVLSEFVSEIEYDDIPEEATETSKRAIRDFVGVAVYGSHHEIGEHVLTYVDRFQSGDQATLIGAGTGSATGAALANGTFGHAVDYDDTFESIVIHPTSPVFSAALAAAELDDGNGRDVLTGYVLGLETAYRVGHSTYPSHYDHGWHSTGTMGSLGAMAATASVLDLEVAEIEHAFGVVASLSSSLKKNFGSMTKPLHAGHAAEMGLRAAVLARDGFTADEDILAGDIGYGAVMTPDGEYDPAVITDGLGDEWGVTDLGFKPYPSGVITHAAMEALRGIVIDHDLQPGDVEEIVVTLDDAASEMLHHENPQNELQAKFSIEFCLAAVLAERDVGIHEFTDEYVTADSTSEQMQKVRRDFEPNLFGGNFANYGARVVVETGNGESITEEMVHSPGTQNNPLPEDRWRDKFRTCAGSILSEDDVSRAEDTIDRLEKPGALDELRTVLRTE